MEQKSKNKKCPRCELNYIEEDKEYCDVCLAEMQGSKLKFADLDDDEEDEKTELCPVCGENYMRPGEKMCDECKKNSEYEEDADIDPDTYNIDVDSLESKITPQTKAIIPVHLYGQCADMEKVSAIAKKHGLAVIEDGAQAIGASRNGVKVGNFGNCAGLSFFPSKNLGGLGDGGMIVTNDSTLAQKLREIRNHGMEPKYYHKHVGGNFRLDAMQAAGISVKLPHLDKWGEMRRRNASVYDAGFGDVEEIKRPVIKNGNRSIYNQYVISVPNRDALMAHLKEKGIGCEIYYPLPLHMQECFAKLGYRKGDFPRAEYAAEHTLALPIYPELTREQLDYVIAEVKNGLVKGA